MAMPADTPFGRVAAVTQKRLLVTASCRIGYPTRESRNVQTIELTVRVLDFNGQPVLNLAEHNFSVSGFGDGSEPDFLASVKNVTTKFGDCYELEVTFECDGNDEWSFFQRPVAVYVTKTSRANGIEFGKAYCTVIRQSNA
jgi:hypothetical protein